MVAAGSELNAGLGTTAPRQVLKEKEDKPQEIQGDEKHSLQPVEVGAQQLPGDVGKGCFQGRSEHAQFPLDGTMHELRQFLEHTRG